MKEFDSMIKMLTEYRVNKERIEFLERHVKHFAAETYKDYIEGKMLAPGHSGKTLKMIEYNNEEVAQLNKVEETAVSYCCECENDYKDSVKSIMNEISRLKYSVSIIEDCLEIIGKTHERYKVLLEKYYIQEVSMEDIAEMLHLSRSRCYELCKEAVKHMVRIVYGAQCESSTSYKKIC